MDGNAALLLKIIRELKRSNQLEFQHIQDIMDLEVSNQKAVAQLATDFRRYHRSRDFDNERTHCRNIRRIGQELLAPLRFGTTDADRALLEELGPLLNELGSHDNEFLNAIEPTMDRVLAAVERINAYVQADPIQLAAARQEQQVFITEFSPKFVELKNVLKRMNEMIEDLIDHL